MGLLARHHKKEEESENSGCYPFSTFFGALIILFIKWFWPTVIPFDLFQFWYWKGSLNNVLTTSWPILMWAVIGTMILMSLRLGVDDEIKDYKSEAVDRFITGIGISMWAGVVEEICFRWILFYSEIVAYKISNFFLCGLSSWIFLCVFGPIANFFTLGYLEPVLLNQLDWAIGAAIVSSNGKFRDGHSYLGTVGYINSWFLGMYFFYVMFHHGLLAAMFIHFLYDFLIFSTSSLGLLLREDARKFNKECKINEGF